VAPDLAPAHPLRQGADRPLRAPRAEATRAAGVHAGRLRRQPWDRRPPVFPKDSPWNTDISQAPVDTSHDYIGVLGSMVLWPDFGGDGHYVSVPLAQPLKTYGALEAVVTNPVVRG
jgi:hypothetical protein